MSTHQHLHDDVFIDGLYGLAEVEDLVGSCPQCASRWVELREKRAIIAVTLNPPPQVLAAQRRNIYARIERPQTWSDLVRLHWAGPVVAAAAAVCLLAVGVFVYRPLNAVQHVATPVSVTQQLPEVYSDVYSMEQSFEPSASASFRVLFEADGSPAEGSVQTTNQ